MGLKQQLLYVLDCDRCHALFEDHDTEAQLVHDDRDKLIKWAVDDGWRPYRGEFLCGGCVSEQAEVEHAFEPDSEGSSLCAICNEWFDDARHPNVDRPLPHQDALPIGGEG